MNRFDVYLADFEPKRGSEIGKVRPCVIVSPDEMNHALNTVIVAPMTSTVKFWPSRVQCSFQGKNGEIALDQIRTIDKIRLQKKVGAIHRNTALKVSSELVAMCKKKSAP